MKTVTAVYEKGVFKPIGQVELPENTQVEFEPRVVVSKPIDAMEEAFQILSQSYETAQPDLAARHDEHQP